MKNTTEKRVHFDFTPNLARTDKEAVKKQLAGNDKITLDQRVERYSELSAYMAYESVYSKLITETRKLYIEEKFYSCIIMCGVTAETIAKDILKKNLFLKQGQNYELPNSGVNETLDRIDMETVRRLLIKSKLIQPKLIPFDKLAELRNKYAHGGMTESKKDALKAIKYLHQIIENTVSIFKDYKILNGKLVPL